MKFKSTCSACWACDAARDCVRWQPDVQSGLKAQATHCARVLARGLCAGCAWRARPSTTCSLAPSTQQRCGPAPRGSARRAAAERSSTQPLSLWPAALRPGAPGLYAPGTSNTIARRQLQHHQQHHQQRRRHGLPPPHQRWRGGRAIAPAALATRAWRRRWWTRRAATTWRTSSCTLITRGSACRRCRGRSSCSRWRGCAPRPITSTTTGASLRASRSSLWRRRSSPCRSARRAPRRRTTASPWPSAWCVCHAPAGARTEECTGGARPA